MHCDECQIEYPDDRKFCPEHGTRLTPVPAIAVNGLEGCPACGNPLQPDKKFCTYCGYDIAPTPKFTVEPKPCPRCGAPQSPEARFCGDCAYNLAAMEDKTEILPPTPFPPIGDPTPASAPVQALEGKSTFWAWLRDPLVHLVIEVSLLLVVGLFSYQLGSRSQPIVANPPTAPDQPVAVSPPPSPPAVAPPVKEKPSAPTVVTPPEPPPPPAPEGEAEFTEEPLVPPRLYEITAETIMRDKPSWSGKKIAQLNTNIDIYVAAILKSTKASGDWLKVQSRSTPPKPSGYVFAEDAKVKE
jgi:predicted nucleic acid-binding Zn ribbon protein